MSRKITATTLISGLLAIVCLNSYSQSKNDIQTFVEAKQVIVKDSFWTPKFRHWSMITANDVLNKFEGKHKPSVAEQNKNNVFVNYDDVAMGKRGTGQHVALPWFDGLVYETISGISGLLIMFPDRKLEERIDGYIDRIYSAQQTDPDGYINTYTELVEPDHRWGDNGGFLRWQHDVYNAGMLVEAGVQYYQGTGKVKLLEVAVRFANYMCKLMGPAPKKNIVPAHSGPEEAMMRLYWLYKKNPGLKSRIKVSVNENEYYHLAKFWIENRGNHCGYPLWQTWGNDQSEKWIKEVKYKELGENSRATWGDYAQDSISVFAQDKMVGHAVRATLLATGLATVALENNSAQYIHTVNNLWDNMAGKRMFVTGGVGAIHYDEKFGEDYFLPTDAYLETCAAVGAGFFSKRMNELTGNGKYMDEFERVLYNNVLTGISLTGNRYTYQNPLNAHKHERWEWHDCPCCPPMFLKLVSALPGYIYSYNTDRLYVNLYIGSEANINQGNGRLVKISQQSNYPWSGKILLNIDPETKGNFSVKLRIPGWALGIENPYDLYESDLKSKIILKVNGTLQKINIVDGYADVKRIWKKGDKIELVLPMQPRIITATTQVKDLQNMVTLASGPVIYCLEECDNSNLDGFKMDTKSPLKLVYQNNTLSGVNVIKGTSSNKNSFIAIPYYAVGNRLQGNSYKVWLPKN